ncbi:RNA polymerase II elongation factor [Geranomyces michiganensis]|nr:RNA polymerase II elongation factor [Geranomyces michiganensis]
MSLSATTVGSLATQLKKALDNHHSSIVDDVLTQLKLMVATADLLKTTGIGVAVNKLRKHEAASADQKQAAKALVAKWKNDVNGDSGNGGGEASTAGSETPNRRVAAAVAAARQDKGIKDGTRLLRMAEELEERTFDENKSTDAQYKNRIKTLKFNLSDPSNPDLVAAVLRGAIPIEMLSNMSTADMASAERKAEIKAAEKIALDNATTVEDTMAETDWFQCSKCKMRKTKYYQMQTRSADEPMTTFVTCVNCGKKWRFC